MATVIPNWKPVKLKLVIDCVYFECDTLTSMINYLTVSNNQESKQ